MQLTNPWAIYQADTAISLWGGWVEARRSEWSEARKAPKWTLEDILGDGNTPSATPDLTYSEEWSLYQTETGEAIT